MSEKNGPDQSKWTVKQVISGKTKPYLIFSKHVNANTVVRRK